MKSIFHRFRKKRKRILLINPLSAEHLHRSIPLSLAYLAGMLRKAGHDVSIIDGSACMNVYGADRILEEAQDRKPDLIGVTIMTPFVSEAYRTVRALKELGVPIVAGGPHPTIFPEETLDHGADFVVRGEGEFVFSELAEALLSGAGYNTVRGTVWRDSDGRVIKNTPAKPVRDLDTIPQPAYDLFDPEWYAEDSVNHDRIHGNLITGRGCPGRCTFCSRVVFGRRVRLHSPERVISEMTDLRRKYGISNFYFLDDVFTVNRNRAIDICRKIETHPDLDRIFFGLVSRLDMIDAELCAILRQAGATNMNFGIESGSDITLKRIQKDFTRNDILRKLKMVREQGIHIGANFILGYPWETPEDVKATIEMVREIEPLVDHFYAGFLIPFPGTLIYKQYKHLPSVNEYWLKNDVSYSSPTAEKTPQKKSRIGGPRNMNDYWYEMNPDLRAQNEKLRDLLDAVIGLRELIAFAPRSDQDIETEGVHLGKGWHFPERMTPDTFRWTDGSAEIFIGLPGMEGSLEIELRPILPGSRRVTLFKNNQKILEKKLPASEWSVVTLPLSDRCENQGMLITIKSNAAIPKQLDINEDTRKLGLQVKSIIFNRRRKKLAVYRSK